MSDIVNKSVHLDAIVPNPRNYRMHPDDQLSDLEASHERFGQFRSVVLWERPGEKYMQVAGHGIVEAMKRRGEIEVRADILPIDTPQATVNAIMIADNNLALKATDDDTLLAELLSEQQNAGYDLASVGSDEESLRQLLITLGDDILKQEQMPEPGDAEIVDVAERWGIILDCTDEQEQLELLERFQQEGRSCRALVL